MTQQQILAAVVDDIGRAHSLVRMGEKCCVSALMNLHFEYACNAWYRSVNAKVKHKLQTAQNKTIRYLLNYGCRRHIGFSDFKKSKCLILMQESTM